MALIVMGSETLGVFAFGRYAWMGGLSGWSIMGWNGRRIRQQILEIYE